MTDALHDHAPADGPSEQDQAWHDIAPRDFWENRYSGQDQVWSGRVNATFAEVVGALTPGRALDLGSGEGADVLWLAEHGWRATGVDISPTAVRRAQAVADASETAGGRADYVAADLSSWLPDEEVDLLSASYLHSPVELHRADILVRVSGAVRPGGHLLVLSHGAPPPWANPEHAQHHRFPTAQEELASLDLDPDQWSVVIAEPRTRQATAPDGRTGELEDVVVLLRRI